MSIKTKLQWKEAVFKIQEELKYIPRETTLPSNSVCNHDRGEYGNCTCGPTYVQNWEWDKKERELRLLLTTYNFCHCGRRVKEHNTYCSTCGTKIQELEPPRHKLCSHWNPQLRFCPDCGSRSIDI